MPQLKPKTSYDYYKDICSRVNRLNEEIKAKRVTITSTEGEIRKLEEFKNLIVEEIKELEEIKKETCILRAKYSPYRR